MKIKFNREYNFGGEKIKDIHLNLEDLSGNDFKVCVSQFKLISNSTLKELEDDWALVVAAKASGLKYDDLLTLKGKDYLAVLNNVKLFLNSGLDTMVQEQEMKLAEVV